VDEEQRVEQPRVVLGGRRLQPGRLARAGDGEHLAGLCSKPGEELGQRGLPLDAGQLGDVTLETEREVVIEPSAASRRSCPSQRGREAAIGDPGDGLIPGR
jgi:hypothetical protein